MSSAHRTRKVEGDGKTSSRGTSIATSSDGDERDKENDESDGRIGGLDLRKAQFLKRRRNKTLGQ